MTEHGQFRSVHPFLDKKDRPGFIALARAQESARHSVLKVYKWEDSNWKIAKTIPVPGIGWDRESQSSVV